MSEPRAYPEPGSGPGDVPSAAWPRPVGAAAGSEPAGSEPAGSEPAGSEPAGEDGVAGEELAARIAELQDQRLRARADLENLRKKCAGQIDRAAADTTARVARQWLPVVDNLDRALAHADADPESIVEGIRAVREQAVSVLDQLGFARSDDLGAAFDPARHDAIASRPDSAAAAGSVVEVVRPGYGAGDSQLRPAQVIVAKAG